jgi:hypothetical protein
MKSACGRYTQTMNAHERILEPFIDKMLAILDEKGLITPEAKAQLAAIPPSKPDPTS